MAKYIVFIWLMLCSFSPLFAQSDDDEDDICQKRVDSILALITPTTPDSVKLKHYHNIGVITDDMDTAIKYANLSLNLCKDTDAFLIASNNYNIGYSYFMQDKSHEALEYFYKSVDLHSKLDNKSQIAFDYVAIGRCYDDLNLHDSCLIFLDRALELFTALNDSANITYTYQSIGMVNMDLSFYATAKTYFQKALRIDLSLHNYLDVAIDYQYLGFIETLMGNVNNSLVYLINSVCMFDTIPNDDPYYINAKYVTYTYISDAYISLAYKNNERNYADSCLAYIEKIGSYYIDNASHSNQFSVLQTYARYLLFLGRDKEALNVLLDCQKYLDTDKRDLSLSDYYKNLSEAYKKNGDYKNALEASDKMHELKESAVNDSTMNVVAKFQADQEVKIHKAEARAKQSRLRVIIMSLIVVLILAFFLVFYIVKMLNIKRKANDELTSKNQILDKQNSEILSQRDKIEDVNRKLYSSINYAQRIQSAAIAQQSEVDALFPYNFVYYKPRDIVSGDFYYVARCGKYNVLVTADCTGHGIPGAFLSMLGISALKEFCVTEEDAENPGTILDRMRLFIKSTLVSDTNRIIDDGMDMTICAFDFENMQLRYAAANQYAIIVRRGDAIKLKGDRMPVGRYIHENEHFSTSSHSLQFGDVVYTFSDGIQDQPGGADDNPLGKKFLVKNLIDFLTEHYTEPLANQCKLIDECITEWRNGRPQVDDMTLIGVRV